ncbi:hypothetical protein CEXT_255441 [Caerostris extrusa]|uniref:Uncharacterized protein n=1 Tax=Caerostris extrusa TaxID=172846 RepID=A0AAV4NF92_CAEEX|nr:hypothetical protein CEXT_255441 [Caerostris extrusa]
MRLKDEHYTFVGRKIAGKKVGNSSEFTRYDSKRAFISNCGDTKQVQCSEPHPIKPLLRNVEVATHLVP